MQKWEYLTIQFGFTGILKLMPIAPQFFNEQELRDWKNVSLHQLVSRLGEDGWEMAGAISVTNTTGNYLFFKRPKP